MTNIDRIKALAAERGISLAFLCSKMGVARVYFNDFVKHGRTDIPVDKLEIIADILNTTVAYLQNESEQKEKSTEVDLLDSVYLSFAKEAREEGISPEDIRLAISTIKRLRGEP